MDLLHLRLAGVNQNRQSYLDFGSFLLPPKLPTPGLEKLGPYIHIYGNLHFIPTFNLLLLFCNFKIAEYILSHLEDKNPANNDGCTPLHCAAGNGHLETVNYIAKHLQGKNPSNQYGVTPISLAWDGNHLEVVAYLESII